MRIAALITLFAFSLSACFDSEDETKRVELVDKRSDEDTTADKQAVSDEDFAALQQEVKTLKNELSALKSTAAGKADASDITALDSEVAALNTSVASLNSTKQPTLWLYDGDGTKKYKVKGFDTQDRLQIAIVEVKPGVVARYIINRRPGYSTYEFPLPFSQTNFDIAYPEVNCGGAPVLRITSAQGAFGWGGLIGNYFIYLTTESTLLSNFSYLSYRDQTSGTCTNLTSTISGDSHQVTVEAKSSYQLKNPLTVGP